MSQQGRITKAHKHTLPPCVSRQSQNPALNCAFKVSQNGKIAAWIRRLRIIWFWRACYQALLHWKCLQNAQLLHQCHLFQMPANEVHDHTRRRKEISWIFQNIAISIYKEHIHLSLVFVNKKNLHDIIHYYKNLGDFLNLTSMWLQAWCIYHEADSDGVNICQHMKNILGKLLPPAFPDCLPLLSLSYVSNVSSSLPSTHSASAH